MATDILTPRRLERERRRTLARFLTTPEAGYATWIEKPAPEPALFRATIGKCDTCDVLDAVVHRFEPHPGHLPLLSCVCADAELLTREGCGICDRHLAGTAPRTIDGGLMRNVWCHRSPAAIVGEFQDGCRLAWWLDGGHMPWLCPRCWKAFTEDELEHLAAIDHAD